jgi:hypothetical protein
MNGKYKILRSFQNNSMCTLDISSNSSIRKGLTEFYRAMVHFLAGTWTFWGSAQMGTRTCCWGKVAAVKLTAHLHLLPWLWIHGGLYSQDIIMICHLINFTLPYFRYIYNNCSDRIGIFLSIYTWNIAPNFMQLKIRCLTYSYRFTTFIHYTVFT